MQLDEISSLVKSGRWRRALDKLELFFGKKTGSKTERIQARALTSEFLWRFGKNIEAFGKLDYVIFDVPTPDFSEELSNLAESLTS